VLVTDDHGLYFLRRKRNLIVSSDFDDAALAGSNLIEMPAVLELDCDYPDIGSDSCLPTSFQIVEAGLTNRT